MKFNVVLLVALVSSTLLVDTCDAWPRIRIRTRFIRRVWDGVRRIICRWNLVKVCKEYSCTYGKVGCVAGELGCSWVYKKTCGKRRRREIVDETMDENEHIVPLPALFETYDLNGDGLISPKEMALATGMDELETLNVAFPLCDTNGDGFLTRKEFFSSPLIVEDIEDIQEERNEFSPELGFSKGDNKTLRANPDITFVKSGEQIADREIYSDELGENGDVTQTNASLTSRAPGGA